jgi:hypothetical protein
MEKTFYLLLVYLCVGFVSCSDDDKDDTSMKAYVPETFTSEFLNLGSVEKWIKTDQADISVGQVGLIRIEGGNGTYTAQSADDEIVEVLGHPSDSKVFTLESKNKLGSTTLAIKDGDLNSLTIPVTVNEYTKKYALCDSSPDIIIKTGTGTEEVEEALEKAIEKKVRDRPIMKGNALILTYETSHSGILVIENGKKGVLYTGVFEETKDDRYTYLNMTIHGEEYQYILTNDYSALLRMNPPETIGFVEDMTALFQVDYPEITQVLVVTQVCI